MGKKWPLASIVVAIFVLFKWFPVEELAKATRFLPDDIISHRADVQTIDQGVRRLIRRKAKSDGRDEVAEEVTVDEDDLSKIAPLPYKLFVESSNRMIEIEKYLNSASR